MFLEVSIHWSVHSRVIMLLLKWIYFQDNIKVSCYIHPQQWIFKTWIQLSNCSNDHHHLFYVGACLEIYLKIDPGKRCHPLTAQQFNFLYFCSELFFLNFLFQVRRITYLYDCPHFGLQEQSTLPSILCPTHTILSVNVEQTDPAQHNWLNILLVSCLPVHYLIKGSLPKWNLCLH